MTHIIATRERKPSVSTRHRPYIESNTNGHSQLLEAEKAIPDEDVTIPAVASHVSETTINRRGVFRLAARGATNADLQKLLCVSPATLVKLFSRELDYGRACIKTSLKSEVIRRALDTENLDTKILIFAAKAFAGLTENGMDEQGDAVQSDKVEVSINVLNKPTQE